MGVEKNNKNTMLEAAHRHHNWAQRKNIPSPVTWHHLQHGTADLLWTSDGYVLPILDLPKQHCLLNLISVSSVVLCQTGINKVGRMEDGKACKKAACK